MSDAESKKPFSRRELMKAASTGVGAMALTGVGTSAATAAPAQRHWDIEADVVVLGFGGAGACAAMAAHDAGAKVLILEKQAEATHVPSTRMSSGIWHSPDKDGDRAAIKAYALAMFSGENVPGKLEGEIEHETANALAEIWSQEATSVIDFLKALDPDFKPVRGAGTHFPTFPGAGESKYRAYISSYTGKVDMTVPTKDKPKGEKTAGEAFFACLKGGIESRKIRVLYGTPAKDLVTNGGGEVIGVVAAQNGKPLSIKAKRGVVITTGGYAWSAAMRGAFLPGPGVKGWAFWGTPAGTGDGIDMAMRAGAGLTKIALAAGSLTVAAPIEGSQFKIGIGATGSQPHSIIVDNLGNRYTDETVQVDDPSRYYFYHKAAEFDVATRLYTRAPSWLIFDEDFRATTPLAMQGIGAVGYGMVAWPKDNLDAVNRGWVLKAETIEELGAKIKAHADNRSLMDPAALARTAARFNDFCSKGKDEDFSRKPSTMAVLAKPPYYAVPLYVGGPNTKGGIAYNAKREVVAWDGKPIPRLYTAGEVSSAFKFVYQSGGNLSEGIIFGRIAGRNAAALKEWS
jgi:glycine/D-amino acid oxidase-like deaminating enzyme